MEILRVVSDIYPHVVGGLGIHAHELSKYQVRHGHNVCVYTTIDNNNFIKKINYDYRLENYSPIVNILGNSIAPQMFFSIFKNRNKYDIIHAHSHLFFSTNLCSFIRKMGSSPLIITNHGLNSASSPKFIQYIYTNSGTKTTLNAADKIICYSKIEKNKLIKINIPSDKIEIIHNGVNSDIFKPIDNKNKSNNILNILWIGRFVKGKGLIYLIYAIKLLSDNNLDFHLTMIGEGPDKLRIINMIAKFNLSNRVSILNYVSNIDISSYYQNSDIFVLPSLEEGIPRTILEAMSCGIPVLCSDLPQLIELIDKCGFVFPKKDYISLAKKIKIIINNPSLAKKMGKNGRKKILKYYSWDDTVKRTLKLYEQIL